MLLYLVPNSTARLDGNFDWGDLVHPAAYGCFVIHTCEQWTHKGTERQGRPDNTERPRAVEAGGESGRRLVGGWWGALEETESPRGPIRCSSEGL